MSYAQDIYIEQAKAHDATFHAVDIAKLKAKDAAREAAHRAEKAAFDRADPWPTDPTALRGHRMGLQEWIRERGD